MTAKNEQIEIIIDNKAYKLSGVENEKYIKSIAEYVDKKIKEIAYSAIGVAKYSSAFLVLVAINIADDFFKEKESVKAKLKKATDNLTTELNSIKIENNAILKELAEVKKELEEVSNQPVDESAVQETEIYKREYDKIKTQIGEVKLELNKAKSQLGSAKCEIEKHKNEKAELRTAFETIKKEKAELRTAFETIEKEKAELRTAFEAIKSENEMMKNGFEKLKEAQNNNGDKERILNLEQELERVRAEVDSYREIIQKNNVLIENAQRDAQQAKKELSDYIETFNV